MPSYHQYQGYRLDLSRLTDGVRAEELAARVEAIAEETDGGDEWLTARLGEIAEISGALSLDLIAFEPDYVSWTLWSLADGRVERSELRFRRAGEPGVLQVREEWMMPQIELPSEEALGELARTLGPLVSSFDDLIESDRSLVFPFEWKNDSELAAGVDLFRPYLGHVPRVALAEVAQPEHGLRMVRLSALSRTTDIVALEPWLDDPIGRAKLLRLWTRGTEVLRAPS